jgi:hypothetical protein
MEIPLCAREAGWVRFEKLCGCDRLIGLGSFLHFLLNQAMGRRQDLL